MVSSHWPHSISMWRLSGEEPHCGDCSSSTSGHLSLRACQCGRWKRTRGAGLAVVVLACPLEEPRKDFLITLIRQARCLLASVLLQHF